MLGISGRNFASNPRGGGRCQHRHRFGAARGKECNAEMALYRAKSDGVAPGASLSRAWTRWRKSVATYNSMRNALATNVFKSTPNRSSTRARRILAMVAQGTRLERRKAT